MRYARSRISLKKTDAPRVVERSGEDQPESGNAGHVVLNLPVGRISQKDKMTYICIECGAEVDYDYLVKHRLKCTKCKEKRSNIWIKKRQTSMQPKTVTAR